MGNSSLVDGVFKKLYVLNFGFPQASIGTNFKIDMQIIIPHILLLVVNIKSHLSALIQSFQDGFCLEFVPPVNRYDSTILKSW